MTPSLRSELARDEEKRASDERSREEPMTPSLRSELARDEEKRASDERSREEPMTEEPMPNVLAVLGVGVVDSDEAVVRADDAGLTRGDGCFEGCRILPDGTVDKPDAHFARLGRSAAAMGI